MFRTLTILAVASLLTAPAAAGSGAGELSLDRSAVATLLRSATPARVPVEIPGIGAVELLLRPPQVVEFVEGGIEGSWRVELAGLGYGSLVAIRLVPRTDPLTGTIRLQVEWANPEVLPPGAFDLAMLLPVVELPRALQGTLPGAADPASGVVLHLHGVELLGDRMVIRFGLTTR